MRMKQLLAGFTVAAALGVGASGIGARAAHADPPPPPGQPSGPPPTPPPAPPPSQAPPWSPPWTFRFPCRARDSGRMPRA
ncbi:hypothetical protein [Mycobacterium sp. E2327]|uniref:hypothetical protein n=1 Tax=Mycobacterium sp. E2327 TaxID=1834132 RepID=UPI0012E9F26B|nr:hypothetical protein [Mycobacterium sp. E2327]